MADDGGRRRWRRGAGLMNGSVFGRLSGASAGRYAKG